MLTLDSCEWSVGRPIAIRIELAFDFGDDSPTMWCELVAEGSAVIEAQPPK
jgi:hypothetical protein